MSYIDPNFYKYKKGDLLWCLKSDSLCKIVERSDGKYKVHKYVPNEKLKGDFLDVHEMDLQVVTSEHVKLAWGKQLARMLVTFEETSTGGVFDSVIEYSSVSDYIGLLECKIRELEKEGKKVSLIAEQELQDGSQLSN